MKPNWGNVNFNDEVINDVIHELRMDKVNAAGDGSVKNSFAVHSWCLFRKSDFSYIVRGVARIHADKMFVVSYRPQTRAVLAASSFYAAYHKEVSRAIHCECYILL